MLIHLQARLENSGGDVVVGFAITDPAPNSIITLNIYTVKMSNFHQDIL